MPTPTLGTTQLLDRASARRPDAEWMRARRVSDASRFMILVDLKLVIAPGADRTSGEIRWLSLREVEALALNTEDALFLGLDVQGHAYFAIAIADHLARATPDVVQYFRPAVDLRTLAMQGVLTPEDQSLAGQARALAQWHENARCCGKCGSATKVKDGGWRRKCWACGAEWFPRTDPVVIMLVTDGERCILAHEHRYVAKMYSTLAGFIEHGEDIEHAVRREVGEETGIRVGRVEYHASQPWPFPHSLMIGCIAHAETTDLKVDTTELADARWFSREEVRAMLENRHPDGLTAPGRHAIANILLRHFVGES
ncbi:NAD(+) diphosphatase [Hyphomicrobium sp. CS1BSMeth3]|uniref:NAD(+) diphosphatase n=1 Tax=Hyphomicrobium sp. CS1BSMeth3 TaxID=1892844 RepID=UPI0009303609|nr:NAD(+) diphosphatase [Hyphomicrobium sp. CS1BSMeth3]